MRTKKINLSGQLQVPSKPGGCWERGSHNPVALILVSVLKSTHRLHHCSRNMHDWKTSITHAQDLDMILAGRSIMMQ